MHAESLVARAHPTYWGGSAGVLLFFEHSGHDGEGLGCSTLTCLVAFTGIGVSLVSFLFGWLFLALWELLVYVNGSCRYGLMWGSLTGPQLTHQTGNLVYGVLRLID